MRHILGFLGVLAAATLLVVSAAMNWRFGFGLGKTEFDAHIYGAASAAADCLKALLPFLILAALRNRTWSQALGGVVLLGVCSLYSLTSSLGFAALNRADTMSERAATAANYEDLRAELARARSEIGWLPQHRPAGVLKSEIAGLQQNRRWETTAGCTNATIKPSIDYCQSYHALKAELATAEKAQILDARILAIRDQLDGIRSAGTSDQVDPQAAILANLSGLGTDKIQLSLIILVSILVEAGSALGFYVALSHWRILEERPKSIPSPVQMTAAVPLLEHMETPAPKSEVEIYFDECIRRADGSSMTALALFEDYCNWCDLREKDPVSLPIFGRELADLGVEKAKIGGRIRYIGIELVSEKGASGNEAGVAAFA
jgi:hypothetical protein